MLNEKEQRSEKNDKIVESKEEESVDVIDFSQPILIESQQQWDQLVALSIEQNKPVSNIYFLFSLHLSCFLLI